MQVVLFQLQSLGRVLDQKLDGRTVRDLLISGWLKIRSKDGSTELLNLNRIQQEYSQICGKRNIVLKARQLGITTYIAARFFIQTITRPGTLTVQVAHSEESAELIFTIVKRFWENLPETLKGALEKSRSNVRQMVFPRIDSEYRVETAGDNAGRGMTIQNLHCSEVSRWPHGGMETLASLRAAVVPEGEIVLESTPNGASGPFYGEWQRAKETGYAQHFFPWWYEDSYREIVRVGGALEFTAEEKELVDRHGLDHEQIAWRRSQWSTLRNLSAQEYAEDANSCFLVSGESVFDLAAIERAEAVAGKATLVEDNGRLTIWLPAQSGRRYIVGVDTAGGGSGGDYACAEVIERSAGMQCAELHGHFPPGELAKRIVDLSRRYEGALLAVERNNHGHAVLAHLEFLKCKNVYEKDKQPGWPTTAANRPEMIENMAAVLMADPELFRSPRLLQECRTFVRHADGTTAAADGAHDDCVMAMAIALIVRREDPRGERKGTVGMTSLKMAKDGKTINVHPSHRK